MIILVFHLLLWRPSLGLFKNLGRIIGIKKHVLFKSVYWYLIIDTMWLKEIFHIVPQGLLNF